MSRFQNTLRSIVWSYGSLVANIVYSLASVPLVLSYLSKAEFGLWVLISQLATYLGLLDFGTSMAAPRILIDYKDGSSQEGYGTALTTMLAVFTAEATVLLAAGYAGAPLLARLLDIPASFRGDFIVLMRWQAALLAIDFLIRVPACVLVAHQRLDILNHAQCAYFVLAFSALWAALRWKWGIYSLLASFAAGAVIKDAVIVLPVLWLKLAPPPRRWGPPSPSLFHELFTLSRDTFLASGSRQAIEAAPTVIVSRLLGLEAAATWTVGTRLYALGLVATRRVSEAASPALSEMIYRGESAKLKAAFRSVSSLTLCLAVAGAVFVAVCNGPFMAVWTHGKITWPFKNDVLLGVSLLVFSVIYCYGGLVYVTKKITPMQYLFMAEAILGILLAVLLAPSMRLAGVLGAFILSGATVSCGYLFWRVKRYMAISSRELLEWNFSAAKVFLWLIVPALLCLALARMLSPASLLAVGGVSVAVVGGFAVLRYGIDPEFRPRLLSMAPRPFRYLLSVCVFSGQEQWQGFRR